MDNQKNCPDKSFKSIGFGGGCHWCTEAVFASLHGVVDIAQGFIAGQPPYDSFSEAVTIRYDPAHIPLGVLIDIHLRTHASGSNHSFREKYRSAIYVTGDVQRSEAEAALWLAARGFKTPRITKIIQLCDFKRSLPQFENYYATDPDRPFCKTYIDPKLAKLKRLYAGRVRGEADA